MTQTRAIRRWRVDQVTAGNRERPPHSVTITDDGPVLGHLLVCGINLDVGARGTHILGRVHGNGRDLFHQRRLLIEGVNLVDQRLGRRRRLEARQ